MCLNTKNSRKTGGGRKIYAKIDLFSTFSAIKVQNVLYLVGKYDTYKGSTLTDSFISGCMSDDGKYDTYKGSTRKCILLLSITILWEI